MFKAILILPLLITITLEKKKGIKWEATEDDVRYCQLTIPGGDYSKCVEITKHLGTNSYNPNPQNIYYKCCWESYKIKMTPTQQCRLIGNTEDNFKAEKKRLKDYYGAQDIKIECSSSFYKFGLLLFSLLFFLL